MKGTLASALFWSVVTGIVVGSAFLYLGLTHGTQSEFYDNAGRLDIVYCIELFAAWFLLGASVMLAAYGGYRALARVVTRRR